MLVDELRRHTADGGAASAHHEADPMRHAASINRDLKPKMARAARRRGQIESLVPASAVAAADVSGFAVLEVTVERR